MKSIKYLTASLLLFGIFAPPANAQLVVNVTEGKKHLTPIAITDFAGPKGAEIAAIVRSDLARIGVFEVQDPKAFVSKSNDINLTPKFANWRQIATEELVVGQGYNENGNLRVEFRLWDVYGESQILGLEFGSTNENWRRIAHKIADAIYKKMTGNEPMFDTRVVYVAESGSRTHRVKRLALMDSDGANPSYLTDGSEQILNPHFNAKGDQIVYSSMSNSGIKIWVFDIESGRKEVVANSGNTVFAPRFSPDGKSIIFSSANGGNVDIISKNLETGTVTRLTNDPAIDTSPAFSPDQKQVVFTSDRSGAPQIYKMNMDGSGVKRLSFGQGQYSTPIWSNKGDLIAFTKQIGGQFQIGVMSANGGNERILTSAYLVESPSFAPNGKAIVFQKEDGPGQDPSLWTIDIDGDNLRKLATIGNSSDPTWSPVLD